MNNFDLLYNYLSVICERQPFNKFLRNHIDTKGRPTIVVAGTVRRLIWKNLAGGLIELSSEKM
jgi:hypothetical protein